MPHYSDLDSPKVWLDVTLAETTLRALLVGMGGTLVLDVYARIAQRFLGMPATNWRMVGRWIGHIADGEFVQPKLAEARAVRGERGCRMRFAVTAIVRRPGTISQAKGEKGGRAGAALGWSASPPNRWTFP